jgi:hypothetical protein
MRICPQCGVRWSGLASLTFIERPGLIANQFISNAVILQTVADQTRIIQQLKREG